jgi:chloramphenicol 3-O-phosphotransferase
MSSSGKSSIAKALLTVLDDTDFHMPVDASFRSPSSFHGVLLLVE